MLQNNFTSENFTEFRRQYNLNLINLANLQTDFIVELPKTLNKISEYTDKISNLSIIAGNCYLSKIGKDFKEIENKNIIFNKDFNTVKLEPELSYNIEPVEYKNKIITNQKGINLYTLSRGAPSATRPSLQHGAHNTTFI